MNTCFFNASSEWDVLCLDVIIRLLSQVNHRLSNFIIHPSRCKSDGHELGIPRAGDDERYWIDINKGCVGSHRCSLG